MSTFDITFDRTFGVQLVLSTTTIDGCRRKGAYLTWLTIDGGYMYWLFEGKITKERAVTIPGTRIQAGVKRANIKQAGDVLTISTANLNQIEADAVATIYEAVSVTLLVTGEDNTINPVEVFIDAGTFQTWDSKQNRGVLVAQLILPTRNSQRA